ncbi:MAG: alpha/beta hydrolase fold domain-containing protein [Sphingomonadales bacterium]|nr:alpha/beta hydrolase fold domain-containing protein [Sphingomonadales bacterium]
MSTRHLVDPELLPLVDSFPSMVLSDESLPKIRAALPAMLAARPLPDLPVRIQDAHIPSGEGGRAIRCMLVQPATWAGKAPAILHFHGGGHVLGVPEMNKPQLMRWAHELGCVIVSVDYRLAPESRFPEPMEDAFAALRWMHEQAKTLGIDATRIAVSGESAGGAMAACLSLMARDRGKYHIAFQHLEQPRLEYRLPSVKTANPFTGEFVWTRQSSTYCRAQYMSKVSAHPTHRLRAQPNCPVSPDLYCCGFARLICRRMSCLCVATRESWRSHRDDRLSRLFSRFQNGRWHHNC